MLKSVSLRTLALATSLCCYSLHLSADTFVVTTTNDAGAGSLRACITSANAASGTHTINFSTMGTITLASPLPVLLGPSALATGITIDGNTAPSQIILDANGNAGLFVYQGNVTISQLKIKNAVATGGTGGAGGSGGGGGGGGLGAGAGVFVNNNGSNPANVTLTDVYFENNKALGGNGGAGTTTTNTFAGGGGGGGGGLSQAASSISDGGAGGAVMSGTDSGGGGGGAGGSISGPTSKNGSANPTSTRGGAGGRGVGTSAVAGTGGVNAPGGTEEMALLLMAEEVVAVVVASVIL